MKKKSSSLKVTINIKSYSPIYINRFILFSKQALGNYNVIYRNPIFLPKKIERFTLLKSPHVDKKAREQFERISYSRMFCFYLPNIEQNHNMLYKILNLLSNFSKGIQVEFKHAEDSKIILQNK